MAAAHGFKPSIGHTEPKRGAEWWGKSVLLTFALFKSEPPSGRNPKWPLPQKRICTRSNPASWSAPRPPSGASPLPHLDRDRSKIPLGPEAAIEGKSNRRTAPPTFEPRCIRWPPVGRQTTALHIIALQPHTTKLLQHPSVDAFKRPTVPPLPCVCV
ncbi:hypothetical protein EUX57_03460 [Pseudomonas orientalis]|uniref:Uncharacterized protein n=1 Tax=Pseudomonas orientalis TaxID=76758 RepID=A0A4Q7D4X6_9PSED|nr:hypothetical protein EUX57_03460 [Pseudomonas orientalis]